MSEHRMIRRTRKARRPLAKWVALGRVTSHTFASHSSTNHLSTNTTLAQPPDFGATPTGTVEPYHQRGIQNLERRREALRQLHATARRIKWHPNSLTGLTLFDQGAKVVGGMGNAAGRTFNEETACEPRRSTTTSERAGVAGIQATVERKSKSSLTQNGIDKVNTHDNSWVGVTTIFGRSSLRFR